jgi:hypothetical protein
MPNDNNLPPLPELPLPTTIELKESGTLSFFSNFEQALNIPRNWSVAYERLQSSSPDAPTYQLVISSGIGTAAANDNFPVLKNSKEVVIRL